MFWISAGNTWCSKYRDKALEKRIKELEKTIVKNKNTMITK